jgi:hypothetical protein
MAIDWAEEKKIKEHSPSIETLIVAKKLALRHKVWFKLLNRVERGIIDLTLKYVNSIKSAMLAKAITAIIDKLKITEESIHDRLVRCVGLPLARTMSKIAVSWGNYSASNWAIDYSYAKFLSICINKIKI